MSDDKSDEEIFRVDTVPPPAGEADAYNAPTRVGPMAAAVVEEMMVASVRKAEGLTRAAEAKAAASLKKGVEEAKAAEAARATARPSPPAAAQMKTPSASPVKGVVDAEALSDSDLISEPTSHSRREVPPRAVSSGKPPPVPPKEAPTAPPRSGSSSSS